MFPGFSPDDSPSATGWQRAYDYDGSGNVIYEGWGLPGDATSTANWAIRKNTYNGSSQLTLSQWANGNSQPVNIWDNRASLTYK